MLKRSFYLIVGIVLIQNCGSIGNAPSKNPSASNSITHVGGLISENDDIQVMTTLVITRFNNTSVEEIEMLIKAKEAVIIDELGFGCKQLNESQAIDRDTIDQLTEDVLYAKQSVKRTDYQNDWTENGKIIEESRFAFQETFDPSLSIKGGDNGPSTFYHCGYFTFPGAQIGVTKEFDRTIVLDIPLTRHFLKNFNMDPYFDYTIKRNGDRASLNLKLPEIPEKVG